MGNDRPFINVLVVSMPRSFHWCLRPANTSTLWSWPVSVSEQPDRTAPTEMHCFKETRLFSLQNDPFKWRNRNESRKIKIVRICAVETRYVNQTTYFVGVAAVKLHVLQHTYFSEKKTKKTMDLRLQMVCSSIKYTVASPETDKHMHIWLEVEPTTIFWLSITISQIRIALRPPMFGRYGFIRGSAVPEN